MPKGLVRYTALAFQVNRLKGLVGSCSHSLQWWLSVKLIPISWVGLRACAYSFQGVIRVYLVGLYVHIVVSKIIIYIIFVSQISHKIDF